ncbi:MAG TPA: hypothetical protein VJO52_06735 [Gemmatimonadaceae bacterium]|nr:hypothetical protein [Gemmatimonadaceae bacterium]
MSESGNVIDGPRKQVAAMQKEDADTAAPAASLAIASTVRAPTWIRRRARNVYRRPLLVSAIGLGVFIIVLVAAVVAPLQERRAVRATLPPMRTRPDTIAILSHIRMAGSVLRVTDSSLLAGRESARRSVSDSAQLSDRGRDSLSTALTGLTALMRRAHDAPLAASYRALGSAPALKGDRRAAALLDTLARIDSSRAAFGAPRGVDPIFVALTARLTQIGKQMEQEAEVERSALQTALDRMGSGPPAAVADTAALVNTRDSAVAALGSARRWLVQARDVDRDMDAADARERSVAAIGASVPAIIAAAAALGVVVGFAVSLVFEVREPRVSDIDEAESIAGASVLAAVGAAPAAPVRRRRADLEMPPLVELASEAYRLLFAQVADRSDNLPLLSIVGEDALTTAVVAANLGAVAARHVRTVLVIDTDVERQSLSSVTRVRGTPGLVDVLAGRVEWAATVRSVVVDRDRTIDVLPSGAFGAHEALDAMTPDVLQLLEHVRRRYDCVLLSAPLSSTGAMSATATLASPVIVVRIARTPIRALERLTGLIRGRGARLRGILMWNRGEPIAVSA